MRSEIFNEICTLCLTYLAICFTDHVLDPEMRSDIGPTYIAINGVMLSVHIIKLLVKSCKAIKQKCKNCCFKGNQAANRVHPIEKVCKISELSSES